MKKRISVFLTLCIVLLCCLTPMAAHAAQSVPYRVQIDWEGTPIFNGPGYDYKDVGDVGEAGLYTIVQEVWDTEGYVWGQLKSGAGWVNLSSITAPVKTLPYIQRIPDKNQPIYASAGYAHRQVGTVEIAANYTIVEEVCDSEGNLWGRLKSGAGWVDLSDVLVNEWEFIDYLIYISDPDTLIYAGADFRDDVVGTIEEAGYYTIVAEHWDDEGCLWGKLKSGKGWIDLNSVLNDERVFTPYLLYIPDSDTPIYAGADERDDLVGTIEEAGYYTIVTEFWDDYGTLWGKLKSGKGWINLDRILSDEQEFIPYLVYISDPDTPIYADADEDAAVVGTVEEAGQYTIVEETRDSWGRMWGKLKSGKGWISLGGDNRYPHEPTYFLQYIRRADQPIFGGPSYDSLSAGTVHEAGTYTIIAEASDGEGNVWGMLKSGAGWIDLTDVWRDEAAPSPVSAGFADENLLLHADYEEYIGQDSEIATYVAFRVYEDVSDVALTSLVWDAEGYEVDRILHTIARLEVGQPFVAALPFYGDMTAYGLSLTDSDGEEHFYAVTISMRNGMLEFHEYTP